MFGNIFHWCHLIDIWWWSSDYGPATYEHPSYKRLAEKYRFPNSQTSKKEKSPKKTEEKYDTPTNNDFIIRKNETLEKTDRNQTQVMIKETNYRTTNIVIIICSIIGLFFVFCTVLMYLHKKMDVKKELSTDQLSWSNCQTSVSTIQSKSSLYPMSLSNDNLEKTESEKEIASTNV